MDIKFYSVKIYCKYALVFRYSVYTTERHTILYIHYIIIGFEFYVALVH